jgi:Holliday junction resolvase RusA-like endonuclease
VNWSESDLAAYQARRAGEKVPAKPKDALQEIINERGFTPAVKEYPIVPVAKPRMTQRDRWKHRPVVDAYMSFKDECRAHGVTLTTEGQHITFIIPMPKSWNAKKRAEMDGKPHQQKPDVDNMLKGVMDAVLAQDCGVWDCRITKRWGEVGKIIINSGRK